VNGVQVYGAEDVAAFLAANPEYTGGRMGYHFVIRDDGEVEQALQLDKVAVHAGRYNGESVGIVVVGDFRFNPPTGPQMDALVELCVSLCRELHIAPQSGIFGHTELPGASSDPYKVCPGKLLRINYLINVVTEKLHG